MHTRMLGVLRVRLGSSEHGAWCIVGALSMAATPEMHSLSFLVTKAPHLPGLVPKSRVSFCKRTDLRSGSLGTLLIP